MLGLLGANGWVREGTVVVVERAASIALLNWPQGWWVLARERSYGDTRLELAERV